MIFKINDDFKTGILPIYANILLGTPITYDSFEGEN